MLGDVFTTVSDGLLGFSTNKGTGIFTAIGASPVKADRPVTITGNMGVLKIRELLGRSPLADSVMDSVENGADRIYCIPVAASTAGTIGQVTDSKKGKGSMKASGTPYNAFEVVVTITGKGGFNSALFMYSTDGGATNSDDLTVPENGSYEIPETGITLAFTEDVEKEGSFEIGDVYRFSTTAPRMTSQDVLTAVSRLRSYNELYEMVHIVGESDAAMWASISTAQQELEQDHHKPLLFVMEAYAPDDEEEVSDYVERLEQDRKKVRNYEIQVVAARSRYIKMDGRTAEQNSAGIVCGLYARTKVHQSIGRTGDSYQMGISRDKMLELTPAGIEDSTALLDAAGYVTFREYDGLEKYYVSNANVMGPEGSDYQYAEDVRVLNKIIREVRKEALQHLQEDIDLTDTQKELGKIAEYVKAPLDRMVEAGEISDAEITVPNGQDIQTSKSLSMVVRYASRGYIRSILVDLGRTGVVISS